MGLLDRLRKPSPAHAPPAEREGVRSQPIALSVPGDARFTYVETVDYVGSDDDTSMSAYKLVEERTHWRYTLWRDDRDRVVYDDGLEGSGNVLPVKDAAFHRPTGAVAVAGVARTEWFADPARHDWTEAVWVRPAGARTFVRAELPGDAWSLDISPDGSLVAALWWWGSSSGGAHCAVVETATGRTRSLTAVMRRNGELLVGLEELRFSPDGRWLLLTSPIDPGFVTMLEVETGRTVDIPCPGVRSAGWWPQRSPSSLLVAWIGADRGTVLGALDLAGGGLETLGPLALPPGVHDSAEGYAFGVNSLSLSPDGSSLVGLTVATPGNGWSLPRHPKTRIAAGLLFPSPRNGFAGLMERVDPASLDPGGAALVEQRRPRWLDPVPAGSITVAAEFTASARGPFAQTPPSY